MFSSSHGVRPFVELDRIGGTSISAHRPVQPSLPEQSTIEAINHMNAHVWLINSTVFKNLNPITNNDDTLHKKRNEIVTWLPHL